ncbi:hypothetical protein T492DRAFT_11246 [Pavlovales sp. CCMP2436]|nr:hypothetical protein T492DRAFT_11246 [Pavlovales sp. CCMP2436]
MIMYICIRPVFLLDFYAHARHDDNHHNYNHNKNDYKILITIQLLIIIFIIRITIITTTIMITIIIIIIIIRIMCTVAKATSVDRAALDNVHSSHSLRARSPPPAHQPHEEPRLPRRRGQVRAWDRGQRTAAHRGAPTETSFVVVGGG